jgi:hypothetical protein
MCMYASAYIMVYACAVMAAKSTSHPATAADGYAYQSVDDRSYSYLQSAIIDNDIMDATHSWHTIASLYAKCVLSTTIAATETSDSSPTHTHRHAYVASAFDDNNNKNEGKEASSNVWLDSTAALCGQKLLQRPNDETFGDNNNNNNNNNDDEVNGQIEVGNRLTQIMDTYRRLRSTTPSTSTSSSSSKVWRPSWYTMYGHALITLLYGRGCSDSEYSAYRQQQQKQKLDGILHSSDESDNKERIRRRCILDSNSYSQSSFDAYSMGHIWLGLKHTLISYSLMLSHRYHHAALHNNNNNNNNVVEVGSSGVINGYATVNPRVWQVLPRHRKAPLGAPMNP